MASKTSDLSYKNEIKFRIVICTCTVAGASSKTIARSYPITFRTVSRRSLSFKEAY